MFLKRGRATPTAAPQAQSTGGTRAAAAHYDAGTNAHPPHVSAYAAGLTRADSERSHSQFEEVDLQNMHANGFDEMQQMGEETLYVSQRGVELPLEAEGDEGAEDLVKRQGSQFHLPLTINSAQYACYNTAGAGEGALSEEDGDFGEEKARSPQGGLMLSRTEGAADGIAIAGDEAEYARDASGDKELLAEQCGREEDSSAESVVEEEVVGGGEEVAGGGSREAALEAEHGRDALGRHGEHTASETSERANEDGGTGREERGCTGKRG